MLKTFSLGGGVATPPLPSTSPSGTTDHFLLRSLPLLSSRLRTPPEFHRLPLLRHARRKRRHCRVDALDGCATGTSDFPPKPISVKIPVGDRHILVETGHIGRQASASVTVTDGETIVYTSVCLADTPSEPSDFFPLSVHYQERLSAAGRTSGGFFKREGRTKDHEVLICRLIDRPLRPTMPKCFYHETQILSWVFSYDGMHSPDCLAVTAAGIAVALSEVPNTKTVAGVRVGLVDNRFIVNPTNEEMEKSELDLLLAGTDDATLMIEGYCNFLSEEHLLQAVKVGQEAVRSICKAVEALTEKCGKPKMTDAIKLPPAELYQHVEEIAGDQIAKALQISEKIPRRKALSAIEDKVLAILSEEGYVSQDRISGNSEGLTDAEDEDEDEIVVDGEVDEGDVHITPVSRKYTPLIFSDVDVKLVYKEVTAKYWRKQIVQGGKRSDGRDPQDIRPINAQCGILPRTHGSAVFTRGETQSLAVVTLGDKQMAQRIDNLMGTEEFKRFYLQYSFPPSCVGEVGRIGAPNRREIGHGMLAERALEPILPSEDDFPYTIRVESTITESNGSSSMASVCGGCLALLDAGVPLRCPVAGVAMGLVLDTKEFGGDGNSLILSDITGAEDAAGDMDLKVAGNEDGITAFQMDIKVAGITLPVIEKALLQAREGKRHVLSEMSKSSPPPAMQVSKHAPLIHIIKVRRDKVNAIIGAGGKKIRSIIEETGVEAIDTDDDGIIKITAKSSLSIEKSKAIIASLTMVPTIGDIYRNCEVKSVASYGVFVEIAPGREALCHISELSSNWLAKAEDVIKIGDRMDVKLIEINEKGQLRLSRKALLAKDDPEKATTQQTTHDSSEGTMPGKMPLTNGAAADNSIDETARLKEEHDSSSKVTSRTEKPKNSLPQDRDVKKVATSTVRTDKWKRSASKTIARNSSKDSPNTANETKAG